MSDQALSKYIQYGTTAERVAFTPDPPVGVQTLYIWYDTDNTPNTYVWNGAAWVQIAGSGTGGINQLTGNVTAGPGTGSQVATIAAGVVTEAMQVLANNTTQNVTSTKHGYAPIAPADATKFLNGAATPAFAAVKDSDLSVSDTTTNNVSITAHGFAPKAPNDSTKFLNGVGAYAIPPGTAIGTVTTTGSPASGNLTKFSGATSITNTDLTGDVTTSGGVAATIPGLALVDDGNSGTTKTIDFLSLKVGRHELTLTGNVTLTLSNPVDGGVYVLLLHTGAGSFTVTWPGTVLWPGGVAPVITVTASKTDLVTLIYDSSATLYYGSFNQNY